MHISHFIIQPLPLALLLYIGPDQALPVLSFIGAAIGILLMWWRRFVFLIRRALKSFSRKPEASIEPQASVKNSE